MAGRLSQLQPGMQAHFSDPALSLGGLTALVDQFEAAVQTGTHKAAGFSSSNYGMSKLALIAATKVRRKVHVLVVHRSLQQLAGLFVRFSSALRFCVPDTVLILLSCSALARACMFTSRKFDGR